MQKSKEVKRVEITIFSNILIVVDMDEHGRAVDRLIKLLPAECQIQFNSPCG